MLVPYVRFVLGGDHLGMSANFLRIKIWYPIRSEDISTELPCHIGRFYLAYQIWFFKECARCLLCGLSDAPCLRPQLDSSKMAESPPNPPMASYPLPSTISPALLSILRCLTPDGLLDLQKYHDYSALLSARVRWGMSTAMDLFNSECGGVSSLLGKANIAASMKKTRAKKCVYGQKGAEDTPIEVIQPE
jgi:hypothetical protein